MLSIKAIEIRNVYTLGALSKKAQARAIAEAQKVCADDDMWDEYILEEFTERLEKRGFEGVRIAYSGFCSQGSGASFTCEAIEMKTLLKHKNLGQAFPIAQKLLDADWTIDAKIERGLSSYAHEKTVSATVDTDYREHLDAGEKNPLGFTEEQVEAELEELRLAIDAFVVSWSQTIYQELDKAYSWLISAENAREYIDSTDAMFYADGMPAHGSDV